MCKECKTNPVYQFTNKRTLCKNCFITYFHKKILHTIRKFHMLDYKRKKNYIVAYKNKKDFRTIVMKEALTILSDKLRIDLKKLPTTKAKKIAIESTIDTEADKIIKNIIKKNSKTLETSNKPTDGKTIKPLYLFLDEEVLLYAKIKKLKYKKIKKPKNKITNFLNELEKKHPEAKRAILNSYLELFPQ